jgi:hypothetical protein
MIECIYKRRASFEHVSEQRNAQEKKRVHETSLDRENTRLYRYKQRGTSTIDFCVVTTGRLSLGKFYNISEPVALAPMLMELFCVFIVKGNTRFEIHIVFGIFNAEEPVNLTLVIF